MSGSIQDILSVKELQEWLHERVADDDDIVIDDLQEEFNEQFDQEDEQNGIKVKGVSEESEARAESPLCDVSGLQAVAGQCGGHGGLQGETWRPRAGLGVGRVQEVPGQGREGGGGQAHGGGDHCLREQGRVEGSV